MTTPFTDKELEIAADEARIKYRENPRVTIEEIFVEGASYTRSKMQSEVEELLRLSNAAKECLKHAIHLEHLKEGGSTHKWATSIINSIEHFAKSKESKCKPQT